MKINWLVSIKIVNNDKTQFGIYIVKTYYFDEQDTLYDNDGHTITHVSTALCVKNRYYVISMPC